MKSNKNIKNNNNNNNKLNQIITQNGYSCLAPCSKPNQLFYHPITYDAYQVPYSACPVYDKNHTNSKNIILLDKCSIDENITYQNYNIFDDSFQISHTTNEFLIEIYNIKNIIDLINFINNNFNELPVHTQKRLLNYFLDVYILHDDLPIEIISEKILDVFFKIYKINLNINKIINKIKLTRNKIKKINNNFIYNNNDFFNYLFNKYSK